MCVKCGATRKCTCGLVVWRAGDEWSWWLPSLGERRFELEYKSIIVGEVGKVGAQ